MGEGKSKGGTVALPSVTADNVEWCTSRKKQYKVIPMKSWEAFPNLAFRSGRHAVVI